jgi:tRNA(Arg) A34 adenosine deaminase TadA
MVDRHARDFARVWEQVGAPVRRSLALAYASLVSGGLACGAVLTDAGGAIVAEGRNRAYDPPGGDDVLQGTPLAHAETNVLAAVSTDRDLAGCTLWTTQEPCSMCTAAAAFTGVGLVRYVAPDPWALATGRSRAGIGTGSDGELRVVGPHPDERLVVAANVVFMLSIARSRGLDHPTIVRNAQLEPDTTDLVRTMVGTGVATRLPDDIESFLGPAWVTISEAAARRAPVAG